MAPRVFFYTSNPGKVHEVELVLGDLGYDVVWRKAELIEPQMDSLEKVAAFKLMGVPEPDSPAMVEDSGLFIPSLGGFPGVYSAYVLRTVGLDGVLRLVRGKDRAAEFRAVVGFRDDRGVQLFTGAVRGRIAPSPRGKNGFGYDPIFIPTGYRRTTAEMASEEKNRLSHRGIAVRKLAQWLAREGTRPPRRARTTSVRNVA